MKTIIRRDSELQEDNNTNELLNTSLKWLRTAKNKTVSSFMHAGMSTLLLARLLLCYYFKQSPKGEHGTRITATDAGYWDRAVDALQNVTLTAFTIGCKFPLMHTRARYISAR